MLSLAVSLISPQNLTAPNNKHLLFHSFLESEMAYQGHSSPGWLIQGVPQGCNHIGRTSSQLKDQLRKVLPPSSVRLAYLWWTSKFTQRAVVLHRLLVRNISFLPHGLLHSAGDNMVNCFPSMRAHGEKEKELKRVLERQNHNLL